VRRGFGVGTAILVVLLAVAVGVGAYNAGFSRGAEDSAGEVVRVVGHHGGFGWIFIPLLIIGLLAFKAMAWRRWHRHGDHGGHHGAWGHEGGLEEYHRRLHEQGDRPDAEPGTA
jgi:hypothetical protein